MNFYLSSDDDCDNKVGGMKILQLQYHKAVVQIKVEMKMTMQLEQQ